MDTEHPEYVDAATAAIREVMEENFRAHTAEDLKALMATMTSNCPDRENFMKECQGALGRRGHQAMDGSQRRERGVFRVPPQVRVTAQVGAV